VTGKRAPGLEEEIVKRIVLSILVAAIAASIATTAFASATPGVDRRECRQRQRITQGVRSGALSRGEARRAWAGERRIHRMEWRAKSDGVVTARERVRLHRSLDRESARIWRLKHNAR
jgi:hypothetical protein